MWATKKIEKKKRFSGQQEFYYYFFVTLRSDFLVMNDKKEIKCTQQIQL